MFTVPQSSSPPATPARRNPLTISNPSTTPAGPPPTSHTAASTTPAGLPPSSVFGSVQNNRPLLFTAPSAGRHGVSRRSPQQYQATIEDDGDGTGDSYDAMDEDQVFSSPHGSADDVIPSIEGLNFSAVAKAVSNKPATLTESDECILGTEILVENVFNFVKNGQNSADDIDAALSTAVEKLLKVWRVGQSLQRGHLGIGPKDSAPALTKAVFVSSLLFAFHHPPRKSPLVGTYRFSRNNNSPKTIPEALLDWLKEYHNQFPNEFIDVLNTKPNVCTHPRFWDVVLSLSLRGNISGASRLLKEADFRQAASAEEEDESSGPGYRGKQLGNIQRVVSRAIAVLDACPAVQSGDWNVKGNDWAIFRKRVNQALSDLETFAEGSNAEQLNEEDKAFEAENFGLSSIRDDEFSISTMSRRAESKVPWFIYQSLVYLYGQLLGYRREIVAAATDWVEASIGLTVWWDGDEVETVNTSLTSNRRSLTRSRGPRQVDLLPRTAYQQKLSLSLRQVVAENDDPELQVNTTNAVEVAIACIFEGDIQSLLGVIRGWSSPVSAGIVEIASLGSWLNASSVPSRSLLDRFDQSDLMVLSFAQQSDKSIKRDDVLMFYANQICDKGMLHDSRDHTTIEGWELAVQILGRLGSTKIASTRIEEIINEIDISADGEVEKVLGVCTTLNLPEIGRSMAEKYSDHVAATSHNYGNALYYYSRAHKVQRIKDVANVLVTSCLVQSAAYPAAKDLDSTLASIIKSPKQTLAKLAALDREAAEMLSANMSGYAMVRRFYDLRDQDIIDKSESKQLLRPLTRKKEAAATLVGLIESAADSIHGGLYDASVESVIQVDGLLALLGEALMLFNQSKRILNSTQIFILMQAVEDLSTVSSAVYSQCEECLKSTLDQSHSGENPPSPRAMLTKSIPSFSTSSSFSMIGSGLTSSRTNSEALGRAREWDWRLGMKRNACGEDVLKILRLELAREVSKVWTEGDI